MLVLDNVTKAFKTGTFGGGTLPAVRGASFEIRPGEVTALIGESGSGKSTLGKMILRLTPVTSGTITFEGTDIATLKGKQLREYYRHVQGVFQDPFSSYNPVYRADRVFATIRHSYYPGVSADEWRERVDKALESVGLNPVDVRDKFTHQLSGGQLQRILIARALLLDIKLLIADEIISMIDASTRVDVLNLLANLKTRGLGVLFVTHDLSLGNYISERTIILRRGAVVEMGATPKVFDNPQHEYTRMLLTSVPQLHKKWEGELGAGMEAMGVTPQDQDRGRPGRYSKSSLHPLAGMRARRRQPCTSATSPRACSAPTRTCGPTRRFCRSSRSRRTTSWRPPPVPDDPAAPRAVDRQTRCAAEHRHAEPGSRLQVCVEEGDDAAAGIQRSLLAVARPRESPQGGEDKWRLVPRSFVVVEEPVPGARVLLDVMLDSDRRQRLLEAVRSAPERPVLGAVARDDRAGSFEEGGGVSPFRGSAVVDARHGEPASWRQHQGEPATHAEADHADRTGAVVPRRE